jgi:orotate phosphoribosyltransferase-like protein
MKESDNMVNEAERRKTMMEAMREWSEMKVKNTKRLKSRGLTNAEISRVMGISESIIRYWVKGS